ncbi:hypothetical protein LEMLEM_LOCUS27195 [Lemmus lemmus]
MTGQEQCNENTFSLEDSDVTTGREKLILNLNI